MTTNLIVALLHTVDFRGDHAADAVVLHNVDAGETVEHLVNRLLGKQRYIEPEVEHIELRIVMTGEG